MASEQALRLEYFLQEETAQEHVLRRLHDLKEGQTLDTLAGCIVEELRHLEEYEQRRLAITRGLIRVLEIATGRE
jgi:hypothetical protein